MFFKAFQLKCGNDNFSTCYAVTKPSVNVSTKFKLNIPLFKDLMSSSLFTIQMSKLSTVHNLVYSKISQVFALND